MNGLFALKGKHATGGSYSATDGDGQAWREIVGLDGKRVRYRASDAPGEHLFLREQFRAWIARMGAMVQQE